MELQAYLRIFRRRWKVVVLCLLIALALALLFILTATPQYVSQTRMFVSASNRVNTDPMQAGSFAIQRVTTYANLVNSQKLADAVLSEVHSNLTAEDFSKRVIATAVPDTVILVISATGPDPKFAQRLSQTTAEQLSKYVKAVETPGGERTPNVRVDVVDPANLPGAPSSPQPARTIGLSALLGLLIGLGLATMRESPDAAQVRRNATRRVKAKAA